MLLSLLSSSFSSCDFTISAEIGAHHVHTHLPTGSSLCLNTSYYPFYLAFYNISSSVTYHEFYSRSPTRHNVSDHTFPGDRLPILRYFDLPYASVTFETSNDTTLTFTYISMPGMCRTGLYFSNRTRDQVFLSPTDSDFFKLTNYEDKCFVFIVPTQQNLSISLRAADAKDTVYLYTKFSNYTAYASETLEILEVVGSVQSPPFIRLVTSRETPPTKFQIIMESEIKEYPTGQSSVAIPRHKEPPCEVIRHWYSGELLVTLIFASGFLFVTLVTVMGCRIAHRREQAMIESSVPLGSLAGGQ